MKIDTVLFEIYTELGLLETLQSEDVQEFVAAEVDHMFDHASAA